MICDSLGVLDIPQHLCGIVAFKERSLFRPYKQHLDAVRVNDQRMFRMIKQKHG